MTFKASTYDAIEAGVYDAVLDDIETGDNDFGPFRKWFFTVQTPNGEKTITAMTSGASGPRSKAYAWATTLLGHKPTGEEEQLRGLPCQVHLAINEDGFNRVAALLPASVAKGQPGLNLEPLNDRVFASAKAPEVTF